MSSIVDTQSHYMPPEVAQNTAFFKVHWSDLDRQIAVMDQFGVEKAVLLYPTSDAHLQMGGWEKVCQAYNSGIAQAVQKFPERFIGGGIVPVDAPEKIPAELAGFRDKGLKVISMASSYDGVYLDDEKFFPVFEFASEHQMPVHIHPQIMNPIGEERVRDPLLSPVLEYMFDVTMGIGKMMMEGTFARFPDVNFIFAHYGGVLPVVKERFDNTYMMLRRREFVKDLGKAPGDFFKNLYFDTSGSKSAASLACALEIVGPERILFASDYPANQDFQSSLDVVRQADLTAEQKEGILGSNVVNLFHF